MENETIQSKRMLHFLGEFFGENLRTVVLFQRLFIAQLVEILIQRYQVNPAQIVRKGNDVYVENKKLNVSIVTASPVSVLMHIGINIDPSGAPVPAIGLNKVARIGDKVSERKFAEMLLETFQNEWKAVRWACAKVRPVM